MRTEKLQLSDVRYNPERSAFEAIVRIHDTGSSFDYPTQFSAPLEADFGVIARGLTQKAHRAHMSSNPSLRMRKATVPVAISHSQAPEVRETLRMLQKIRALAA